MTERTPIFDVLNTARQSSNEFFVAIRGWQKNEIEHLSPARKDFVQDHTMRMVYACMDVLARINPEQKVTLIIERVAKHEDR